MPEQAKFPEFPPEGSSAQQPVAYYTQVAPQQEIEAEAPSVPITHYLWILRRHFWKIAAFVAICVLVTGVVTARLRPIYESTATVDVNFSAPSAVVGQDSTDAYIEDPETFLATQTRLIQSDAVLRPVAEQFHLLKPVSQQGVTTPISMAGLQVSRPSGTNLLLISYRSTDPRQAADIANAVANSFLART